MVIALNHGQIDLDEVTKSRSLSTNSFHTLSVPDLSLRPVNSSLNLMRLVHGIFIAQQMGRVKSEQIFVRDFDANHGTDLYVSVDGLSANMASHIEGQGYLDFHAKFLKLL